MPTISAVYREPRRAQNATTKKKPPLTVERLLTGLPLERNRKVVQRGGDVHVLGA